MFGISFANPVFISALALVGVPLAIHMLTLRTPKRILFPTVRFIKRAEASQSALFRLRHWILLALRTLLVLLLVFTFLRPVLTKGMLTPPAQAATGNTTIVILDNSMSMGWQGSSMSPFDRGRQTAHRIIADAGSDELLNLIIASGAPTSTFKEPSGGAFLLKQDLEKAKPTLERANIDAALAEAARQFSAMKNPSGALNVITDGQRTNWSSVRMPTFPKDVEIIFHTASDAHAENVAVTEITVQPPEPAVGEEVTVSCKVANYSTRARSIPVTLSLHDEKDWEQTLELEPNASGAAQVRFRALRGGVFSGHAQIAEDGLAGDDRRSFSFTVQERVRVVVVSREDAQDFKRGLIYLLRAISPRGESASDGVIAEVAHPDRLDKFTLATAQVVLLHGADALSGAAVDALHDYLSNGGGLIWFVSGAGDKDSLANLAAKFGEDFQWPVRYGMPLDRGIPNSEAALFSQANFDHPLLRRFRDRADIAEIGFLRYFATERIKDRGQVLMKFNDDTVAIAKSNAGVGQVLLCNFSPAREASDLSRHPVFLPLIHEMIRHMRPEGAVRRSYEPGGSFAATVSMNEQIGELAVYDPTGERINAAIATQQSEAMVFCPRAEQAGIYEIRSGDTTLSAVAVNPDSRESDLAPLDETALAALVHVGHDRILSGDANSAEALGRLMEGRPIWHYLLLAALLFLAIEQLLALRWMKRGQMKSGSSAS